MSDLQKFCKMLNESKNCSFFLKNVRVLRAAKKLGEIGAPKTITGTIVVEEAGYRTFYDFESKGLEIQHVETD